MADLNTLNLLLGDLEAALPQMMRDHPDLCDFWPAFAGLADVIEDNSGVHYEIVANRIDRMLQKHGLSEVAG